MIWTGHCQCPACVERRAWEKPEERMSQADIDEWARRVVEAMRPSGRRLVRELDDRPRTL